MGRRMTCAEAHVREVETGCRSELADSARLALQRASGILLCLPPQHWNYKHAPFCLVFTWCRGSKLRSSCVDDKQFTRRLCFCLLSRFSRVRLSMQTKPTMYPPSSHASASLRVSTALSPLQFARWPFHRFFKQAG